MAVSVIIVNWNSKDLLRKCLQHLSRQTIQPDRVIVIDNNSTDDSLIAAEDFKNVVVKKMDSNLGFAAGNNQALYECDTEWVALLNPDAFPEADWLESLLNGAESNPDFVAFGSRQLCQENPAILDGIGDTYHISGAVRRERHNNQQQADDLIAREIFSPCAAAALYKRQALNEVGLFDDDYFCYLEDVDLGFRLRLAGYKSMYLPDAVVHHVGSATTGGHRSDFSVYHGHRNMMWTFVKNMPGILFWLLLPLHLLLNMFSIIWFTLHGQGKVILKAKWDAIKGLPEVWAKRKQIQRNRVVTAVEIWRALNKGFTRSN
ncbi:MAG: glycosyltransferase family 2 protein [Methylococcales bacterium]